jgi:hypothetical protein
MTTQVLSVFFMLGLTGLAQAALGPGSSGGGKGVVCRDQSRNVLTVETLDLWEAREIYGLRPELNSGSLRKTVLTALENLSHSVRADEIVATWPDGRKEKGAPVLFGDLQNHAYPFFKKADDPSNVQIRWLKNVNLAPTNDAYESATPTNCAIEQIVAFGDTGIMTGKMLINEDLWDRMDETNQAALIVHEAYYKLLRSYYAELSSLRVRRAVGLAFSGHAFGTLNDTNLPKEFYQCEYLPKSRVRSPSQNGVSRVFLLPVNNPVTGKTMIAFQAASLGNVSIIGTPPITTVNEPDVYEVDHFDDLSKLVSRRMNYSIRLRGTVQEEMDPSVQILKAGPRGSLKVSVSAPISVFLPEGLDRVMLDCKYKH